MNPLAHRQFTASLRSRRIQSGGRVRDYAATGETGITL